jgi:hypothetical protein
MHLWKDSICSTGTRLPNIGDSGKVVHCSEHSWLMGEQVTSEITLLILPNRIHDLVKKMQKQRNEGIELWVRKKWWCALVLAIPFLLLVLLLAALIPLVVLAFIAASIVMDILRMLGKICKRMQCKLCTSASGSTPQVGSYLITSFYSRNYMDRNDKGHLHPLLRGPETDMSPPGMEPGHPRHFSNELFEQRINSYFGTSTYELPTKQTIFTLMVGPTRSM